MDKESDKLSRRGFLKTSAAAGMGAMLSRTSEAQEAKGPPAAKEKPPAGGADELRVALIGAGEQGRVLLESCLRIPGLRVAAVCDIWSYSQQYARGYLRKHGQDPAVYEDYR